MKFGKELKKQMVPEWTEAYVDYSGLKRILREYNRSKVASTPLKLIAMHKSFSGLNPIQGGGGGGDIEDQIIDVISTLQQEEDGSRKLYKTEFLKKSEEGGDIEVIFFEKLDQEFNKVNSFYMDKFREMVHEASLLNKQMEALIALRIKVAQLDLDSLDKNEGSCSDHNVIDVPSNTDIDLGESINTSGKDCSSNGNVEEVSTSVPEINEVLPVSCGSSRQVDGKDTNANEQDPLKILRRVTISNTFQSPFSAFRGVFKLSKERNWTFNKEELGKVEQRLKHVFIEFYHKLYFLKQYSYINLAALSKILKKYEKITTRKVSKSYMKIVENSYLGSSDEVSGLLQRVEASFIKHFCNSNRRKGMKSLRPKGKREKHIVTFFSGFFCGCSVALFVAVILRIQSRKLLDDKHRLSYVVNIVPLYSFFAYAVLQMFLYAVNIYFWRRYQVNYPFICGFKQGTELGHREVFLLSQGLSFLALAGFLANLQLNTRTNASIYMTVTEMIPLGLIAAVLIILLCPLDVLYRSSRFFFIQCLFRCLCTPLFKATLPDVLLMDHFCSQVPAIRCLDLYICYYGLKEYSTRTRKCHSHGLFHAFYFVIGVIPFWIRFLQCVRRLCEEKDALHAYNALKYMLIIIAVLLRTFCELTNGRNSWMLLAMISSGIAVTFATYWDIAIDWGLLRRKSTNPFLRDKLIVSQRSVYFVAMGLNVVLRIAWMQSVLEFYLQGHHRMVGNAIFACLEIIRRGIWSFFRLENEHLNNVGKFRAFKSVPLPFSYNDSDDDKND